MKKTIDFHNFFNSLFTPSERKEIYLFQYFFYFFFFSPHHFFTNSYLKRFYSQFNICIYMFIMFSFCPSLFSLVYLISILFIFYKGNNRIYNEKWRLYNIYQKWYTTLYYTLFHIYSFFVRLGQSYLLVMRYWHIYLFILTPIRHLRIWCKLRDTDIKIFDHNYYSRVKVVDPILAWSYSFFSSFSVCVIRCHHRERRSLL